MRQTIELARYDLRQSYGVDQVQSVLLEEEVLVEVVREPVQQHWLQLLVADRPQFEEAAREEAREEEEVMEEEDWELKLQHLSLLRLVVEHVEQQAP